MDFEVLSNFLKIAEYQNITKAAQDLHIAQPHLTRQLHNLEEELGVQLFSREKKRLHITEEGIFFKQQVKQILALTEKTKKQINEMQSEVNGTLYIGSIETVGNIYLPQWISDFKNKYPNVKYNLWSGNSNDVIERLDKGLIDLAIVREPFDNKKFNSWKISEEKWIVLINKQHSLAKIKKALLSLEDLESEEIMVPSQRIAEIAGWFEKEHLNSNIICGFSPLMNAIVMVENNLGVAILPESCKRFIFTNNIIIKNLSENKTSTVSIIWKKDNHINHVTKKFLESIKDIFIQ